MQQPQLVLAIEPDPRQAAIVKRIVREKVLADVAVVDSRDAALEAMRTTVPDVLLLSALLSPRDEDELFAHLRSRQDTEHLQTHTIPQLASTIGGEDAQPSKGLLSAFRRRKGSNGPTAGCDPDLFAEEIRTYLKRASEKKREVRDTAPRASFASRAAASEAAGAASEARTTEEAPVASSWESPFEWRPSGSRASTPPAVPPAPVAAAPVAQLITEPEPVVSIVLPPVPEPLPPVPEFADAIVAQEAVETVIAPEPVFEPAYEPPPAPAIRLPLTLRTVRGWWFVEGKEERPAIEPDSDLREMLSRLAVPMKAAGVAYADGCRIRRVRLAEA
jgi:CheY-like chemotaxis protein